MKDQDISRNHSLALGRNKILAASICIFLMSCAVRQIVWQNNQTEAGTALWAITLHYKQDSEHLLMGDIKTFLAGPEPPSNAEVLSHPPGYSILMTLVYGIFGGSDIAMRTVQILLCSLAPVLVFLISLNFFSYRPAAAAGILTAFSPQNAYNSVMMLPDAMATVPLLFAIYFFVIAYKKQRLVYAILCGAFLGISCWLRANGLLLPIFFAAISLLLLSKPMRRNFAILLLVTFALVIAPITIRNYIVFNKFIPIGLGTGINLMEGIGDFDKENRFGMPATDLGVQTMEAERHDRPDYVGQHYNPDGILRDSERTRLAVEVIKSEPLWFAGVVARRAASFLRFERVPQISSNTDPIMPSPIYYHLNIPLRLIQKFFITAVFLPLAIIGVVILLRKHETRKILLIVLVIPIYYIGIHSIIHTEYRYVMAVQYFNFMLAAVAIFAFVEWVKHRLADRTEANQEFET